MKLLWLSVLIVATIAVIGITFVTEDGDDTTKTSGKNPYYFGHIGFAEPKVWQNNQVLDNFKLMYDSGVEIKLTAGLKSFYDEPCPGKNLPVQFGRALKARLGLTEEELFKIYRILPNRLRCNSVVAGGDDYAEIYITSHEKKNIFPSTYFKVRNKKSCLEWKVYLLSHFNQVKER